MQEGVKSCEALRRYPKEASSPYKCHAAFVILTRCVRSKLSYDSQLVPPCTMADAADALHAAIEDVFQMLPLQPLEKDKLHRAKSPGKYG